MNSKTRVFIWGSCVSRDTFEHMDPNQYELVAYVARQSALSATTRPVEQIAAPQLASRFQQRMVSGDFGSNLRPTLAEQAATTDVLLVDLTDERLGVYLLPDGTVVTRSVELIESGMDQTVAQNAQHLPFGTQQHYEYWSGAIQAAGDAIRQTMPGVTVALLDIPWAEWSESGQRTPDSFGVTAAQANPVFRPYVETAVQALGAHLVSIDPSHVSSGPTHPWGEAPFHYSENVYVEAVRSLTGAAGRVVWGPGAADDRGGDAATARPTSTPTRAQAVEPRAPGSEPTAAPKQLQRLQGGPNFLLAGTMRSATTWLQKQLSYHPDIFVTSGGRASNFFNNQKRVEDPKEVEAYLAEFAKASASYRRGERSTMYFWEGLGDPRSPRRAATAANVAQMVDPNAPIVLSLRDPVSRAVSGYWAAVSNGQLDLSRTIFRAPPSMGLIDLGHYRRHYESWAAAVGPERIDVVLYDDIVDDPRKTVAQLLRVLEVDETAEFWSKATLEKRENHKPWTAAMKKSGQVSPQEIAFLLELYEDDIAFMEHLLGRRLDAWRDIKKLVAANTK
ncbi:DUF6270 domain-containing protein [Myceligenerans pegani]|uniref:Sulfotransferase n=1 Tax=Myceligenerans pegani TaxID=2776917 RepID=A0ABR9N0F0_9MICO|nr:DUF6270 domain-containing protein [Myceligenerans sp. TRM 65318]MBE1877126.1 sulfotransferase [Myceligenerans sp. TRM 65318]MBE3019397.1 sulfotransferase [Myceligenerans sp. TRM 65318]